jgi:hypothetical protein
VTSIISFRPVGARIVEQDVERARRAIAGLHGGEVVTSSTSASACCPRARIAAAASSISARVRGEQRHMARR